VGTLKKEKNGKKDDGHREQYQRKEKRQKIGTTGKTMLDEESEAERVGQLLMKRNKNAELDLSNAKLTEMRFVRFRFRNGVKEGKVSLFHRGVGWLV